MATTSAVSSLHSNSAVTHMPRVRSVSQERIYGTASRARPWLLGDRRKRLPQERSRRAPAGRAQPAAAGAALSGRRRQRERPAPESARPGECPGQSRSVPGPASCVPGPDPECPRLTGPVRSLTASSPCRFLSVQKYPSFPAGGHYCRGGAVRAPQGRATARGCSRGVPGIDPFPLPEICWE